MTPETKATKGKGQTSWTPTNLYIFYASKETIKKWLNTFVRRFFSQQFKRSCLPDGPAAGPVSLSPRGGWVMPSDAWNSLFSKDADSVE